MGGAVVEVPQFFVQIFHYLVQLEVLEADAHVVAFGVGLGDLFHGHESLPHGLQLAYVVRHGQPSVPARPDPFLIPLLSLTSVPYHLPAPRPPPVPPPPRPFPIPPLSLTSVHCHLPVRRQLHPTISGVFPAPSCPP